MLARHLLFIATRRHQNTVLAIDSVPPHGIVQPPPYISPPKPEECQKDHKIQEILKDSQSTEKIKTQCEKQQSFGQQGPYPQKIYTHDPRQNLYNNNNKFIEQNKVPSYQRQIVHMHNARNQQFYGPAKDNSQHFYTLPSRRPQRDVEPPRSVTPDITRGLGRGSLSAMHMLARHGQRAIVEQDSSRFGSQAELNRRNSEKFDVENRLMQNQHQPPIVDVRNRFATPSGLAALGYRFFASSPVSDPVMKSPSADALKHNPISPIRHSYGNSLKQVTPTGRTMPTVAERLALTANNNCSSSVPNSGRSTPVQTSSGRSTPTNLILSPTKSTMSNEELFAAIHKSKRRLNIKDDSENLSPYGSTNSLTKIAPGNRNSWSSETLKVPVVTQNVQAPSPTTSRLDFKRLLLQQSVKTGPTRLSAAEQLKLSRQQCQQQQSSPTIQQTIPLAKVLSPRSVWRFHTPRTDILSSTIIEDTAAEEKAMKPSPENTSPISRLNARRQLDLCNDSSKMGNEASDPCINRLLNNEASSEVKATREAEVPSRNIQTQESSTENHPAITNHSRLAQNGPAQSPSPAPSVPDSSQSNIVSPTIQYSPTCSQLTPSCQQAINAFESRRISNQLARAQFLASTPTSGNQSHTTYVRQVLRARSVSPQNSATQNVARSPSAPTLETAL